MPVLASLSFISRNFSCILYFPTFIVAATMLNGSSFASSNANGFDLRNALVPIEEIHHGGPPRDGIPAINKPLFVEAKKATYLNSNDRVLGLIYKGIVRAYPIKILNHHEIVNDKINNQAVVISYCPLCGSGMAFKAELDKTNRGTTFGVSGLLYNSDMLLYDRNTNSLWSQILGTAISGPLKGEKLQQLALVDEQWAGWQQKHPNSQVLSTRTGYSRNYNRHPYGDYDINSALYFPVSNTSSRYHPKERVVGLILDEQHKAYPFSEISKLRSEVIQDNFAGEILTIQYDSKNQSVRIFNERNQLIPVTTLFWFAWVAFYPDTEVFMAIESVNK